MNAMIDTLKFAKNFETAGFAKPQAEALTVALAEMAGLAREDLVTKADLIAAFTDLRSEFRDLGLSLSGSISRTALKSDLQIAVAELKTEIVTINATTKSQILWALFGSQLFVIAAVAALSNFAKFFS